MNLPICLLLILISVLTLSCAPTYVPVKPEPLYINAMIYAGDTIKVTTKDNKDYEFVVVEITEDAIIGETDKVLINNIHQLQVVTESSGEKTGRRSAVTILTTLDILNSTINFINGDF